MTWALPRVCHRAVSAQQIYGIPAPATPRNDLFEIYLTGICAACGPIVADLNAHRLNADARLNRIVPAEELRLNMSIPPTAVPNHRAGRDREALTWADKALALGAQGAIRRRPGPGPGPGRGAAPQPSQR